MASSSGEVDFLDEIFMSEQRLHEDGYREGYEVGARTGHQQGYEAGRQKAAQIGGEVGFYQGCAKAWTAVLEKQNSQSNEKKLRAVEALKKLLDGFHIGEVSSEDYWDELTKIRAKFKQVSSLLKISTEFVEKTSQSGLSF